ncbi:MAG: hypothetical protein H6729_15015 [Deltaproteobacteria bacterium]|nr:hypothetical protein [Deltaproteobacteria bacterium]
MKDQGLKERARAELRGEVDAAVVAVETAVRKSDGILALGALLIFAGGVYPMYAALAWLQWVLWGGYLVRGTAAAAVVATSLVIVPSWFLGRRITRHLVRVVWIRRVAIRYDVSATELARAVTINHSLKHESRPLR